jgi:acetyltransferase
VFTFPSIFEAEVLSGRISMIVQSGALISAFLPELMNHLKIGISKLCSIGNKADIDDCDLLEYLLQDDNTDAVALYMESIPRARLFLEMVSRSPKPVVVLPGGLTESGARAAMSHTASLAGDARLSRGLLEAAGVQLAEDFNQMVDYTRTLAVASHLNPDSRLGVVTFSGGASILSCDLFEKRGIRMSRFSSETLEALSEIFPPWMPPANPADLGPSIQSIKHFKPICNQAVEIILKDPGVDIVLVHYFLLKGTEFDLEYLKKMADRAGKVLIFWAVGLRKIVDEFRLEAQSLGLVAFSELDRAADSLAAALRYRSPEPGKGSPIIQEILKTEDLTEIRSEETISLKIIDEFESKRLLSSAGIAVVEEETVDSLSDTLRFARKNGYPLVLKGLIPETAHKTEMGLVKLNLYTESQLEEAYAQIESKLEGSGTILVQRQVKIDYELVAGYIEDVQFGPCVLFGVGGQFVELDPDIAFALAPLDRDQAAKLIGRIRSQRLIQGFREMKPLDRERMAELLVNLSVLGISKPLIKQIDINPVAVQCGLPVVVDANVFVIDQNPQSTP